MEHLREQLDALESAIGSVRERVLAVLGEAGALAAADGERPGAELRRPPTLPRA